MRVDNRRSRVLLLSVMALAMWLSQSRVAAAYTGATINVQDGKAGSMVDWANGYILVLVNNSTGTLAATCFHPKSAAPASFTCAYGTDDLGFGLGAAPVTPNSITALVTFVGNAGLADCDTAPVCSGPNGVPGSRPADIQVDYIELPFGTSRALGTRQTNSGPLAVDLLGFAAAGDRRGLMALLVGVLAAAGLVLGRRRGRGALAGLGVTLLVGGGLAFAASQAGVWVSTGIDGVSPGDQVVSGGLLDVGSGLTVGSSLGLGSNDGQWTVTDLTVTAVSGPSTVGAGKVMLSAKHGRSLDLGYRSHVVAQVSGGSMVLEGRQSNKRLPWSSDGADLTVQDVAGSWETLTKSSNNGQAIGGTEGILQLSGRTSDGRDLNLSATYTQTGNGMQQLGNVVLQIK